MFQDYYNPIRIFSESKATAVLTHLATTIGGTLHYFEKTSTAHTFQTKFHINHSLRSYLTENSLCSLQKPTL